jgi:uncharacterized protein (TIGR03437 family)
VYSIVVGNDASAGPTTGTVTVTQTLPFALTLISISGSGWNCMGGICTRNDTLNGGSNYPPLTAIVNVGLISPAQIAFRLSVSGGGSPAASFADQTAVSLVPGIYFGGVVSVADYSSTLAPGSIAAVFGTFGLASVATAPSIPLPVALGGMSLEFAGRFPAPIFAATESQTNIQIPWELAGSQQAQLAATVNGQPASLTRTVTIAPFAPGIFTADQSGSGQGIIFDASGRLVNAGNPAVPGSTVVVIYCTGLGAVTNQPATGAAAPSSPLAVTTTTPVVSIGGALAQVLYSGLVPGLVGEYQVNALVPSGAAVGNAAPVTIVMGSALSNVATMAVAKP